MAMPNPASDVATRIASALSLVVGTTVFVGPVRAAKDGVPSKAVFCLNRGGPGPEPYTDGGVGADFWTSEVQVRVRGEARKTESGETFARSVRDAIHTASIAPYFEIRVLESEPIYLAEDDAGCPEWSINVQLRFKE